MARLLVRKRGEKAQGLPLAEESRGARGEAEAKKTAAPEGPTLAQIVGRKPTAREEKGQTPIGELTQAEVSGIISRWRHLYKLTTLRRMVSQLRWPLQQHNPRIRLPRLPAAPVRGVTATPAEIEGAVRAATPGLKLALILAADSGLRYSEILSLRPHHWKPASHTITFKGKGDYERTVPVSARAEALFSVLTGTEPFIQQLHPHKNHSTINRQWNRLRRKLGMERINIHDLRRTIATRLYTDTKDLRAPQALLGHKTLSSTIRYLAPIGEPALQQILSELIRPFKGERTP